MTPEPYTPTPGGRYFVGADGVRVRLIDTDTPAAPATSTEPAPAPAPAATAPKTPSRKD